MTQKVVDKTSIKGQTRRIWMAQKYKVDLTFTALTVAQYQYITAFFYGGASAVTYLNTASGVTFSGFATAAEDNFIQGASNLLNLTITMVQT